MFKIMSLSTQPYKGARDFYPEDKRLQKYMFSVLRSVVESFGYHEYDAPLLEPFELYAAKSGDELVNEQLYSFEDRGGRKLAIRPEMTPSVSRMVAAKRQELPYPLRLYSIPILWRYERPQRGRLREHGQLNVDIFGVEGIEADFEIIQIADSILRTFGASEQQFEIKINSRKLLNLFMKEQGYDEADKRLFLHIADKLLKFEDTKARADYIEEKTKEAGYGKKKQSDFLSLFDNYQEALDKIYQGPPGDEARKLHAMLHSHGIPVKFDPFLIRGFDYYTDIVFEVFDTNPENNRSMFGGGRYDGLVEMFGVEPLPVVGFGMGDVSLMNFLDTHQLVPQLKPESDVIAILVGDVFEKAQPVLSMLRDKGINVAVDFSGRKLDSQIKSAVKSGVRQVVFIGEKEIESGEFKLRDLEKGEEKKLNLDQVASSLKAGRPDN